LKVSNKQKEDSAQKTTFVMRNFGVYVFSQGIWGNSHWNSIFLEMFDKAICTR